jgi:hypothetical protein
MLTQANWHRGAGCGVADAVPVVAEAMPASPYSTVGVGADKAYDAQHIVYAARDGTFSRI